MSLQNIIQRMYKKLTLPLTAETISNMSRNVAQTVVDDRVKGSVYDTDVS